MFDGEAFGQQMVEIVRGYVDAATAPLLERIDALEKRELVLPEKGDPGVGIANAEVRANVLELTLTDGTVLKAGDVGPRHGKDGAKGADGIGLADALKDDAGNLVLVLTDGRTKILGPIDGKDGKDGKDGETFTLDDFDVVPLDERTIKMGFTKDAVCHSFELEFPVPIYRGVHKDGEEYTRGDLVTWAGSLWHCNEPKAMKPGTPESGWQLAAKAGRPGKDAK